jgi:ATPase subunit of ABC transporter with duplicated ATPase domains
MEMKPSNFLILDEPTNHLDEGTKNALRSAIDKFPGNVIIVSHEVSFTKGFGDRELNVAALSFKNETD